MRNALRGTSEAVRETSHPLRTARAVSLPDAQEAPERHIVCEPIMEGGKLGDRFTATGTFDHLLTGMKVVDESGGGQGN